MRPLRPGVRAVRGRRSVADVVADAERRGAAVHLVGPAGSKAELLDGFAGALRFPGWVGRNWDALADALGDLSWLPGGPLAVLWVGPGRLEEADPGAYRTALEVLTQAAEAPGSRPLTVLLVPDGQRASGG